MKLFDKYQKIITITGLACFALSSIFYVWMVITATPLYDESELIVGYDYQVVPNSLYSIFAFLHIACVVWFVIRLLTYKTRLKEYEQSLLI